MNFSLNTFTRWLLSLACAYSMVLAPVSYAQAPPEEAASEDPESSLAKGVSNTPTPTASRAPLPDQEKLQQSLIATELEEEGTVTLQAAGKSFLAVWESDHTGKPFGAVILLHGAGETADWPDSIRSMRAELPDHGWAALAISLPNPTPKKPPARPTPTATPPPTESEDINTANTEPTPENSPAPAATDNTQEASAPPKPERDIEKESTARLAAAISYLNDQGHFNIVLIGNGLGATRAARYISGLSQTQGKTGRVERVPARRTNAKAIIQRPIRALIIVSARNIIPTTDIRLPELLVDPELPVLDVVFNNHYLDEIEARNRKQSARENRLKHYFQVKLIKPRGDMPPDNNRLVRRVRGFLNKYAKGVEIEK